MVTKTSPQQTYASDFERVGKEKVWEDQISKEELANSWKPRTITTQ